MRMQKDSPLCLYSRTNCCRPKRGWISKFQKQSLSLSANQSKKNGLSLAEIWNRDGRVMLLHSAYVCLGDWSLYHHWGWCFLFYYLFRINKTATGVYPNIHFLYYYVHNNYAKICMLFHHIIFARKAKTHLYFSTSKWNDSTGYSSWEYSNCKVSLHCGSIFIPVNPCIHLKQGGSFL